MDKALAQYINVPTANVARLLNMKQSEIYEDDEYQSWISSLDADLLYNTLANAREAYSKNIEQFNDVLKSKYKLKNTPMSEFTLGNWLIGFLQYPANLASLTEMHNRLPRQAVIEMLPSIIKILDEVKEGRTEWQKALSLIALPLAAQEG